jgi:hypothetical protein
MREDHELHLRRRNLRLLVVLLAFVTLLFLATISTMVGHAENPWGRDEQAQAISQSALKELGLLLRRLKRL